MDIVADIVDTLPNMPAQALDRRSFQETKDWLRLSGALVLSRDAFDQSQSKALKETSDLIRTTASRSPACGLALCMHHHVVITWLKFENLLPGGRPWLNQLLDDRCLFASAFAEGIPGKQIFESEVKASRINATHHVISGVKKPTTLSSYADYYAVSVRCCDENDKLAIALIPSSQKGIRIEKFWHLDALQAADNNAVVFDQVELPNQQLSLYKGDDLVGVLSFGICSFSLFAISAYAGVIDRMLEKLPPRIRQIPEIEREIKSYRLAASALISSMIAQLNMDTFTDRTIASVLAMRYQFEDVVEKYATFALKTSGGVQVMSDPELLYLFSITQFLRFHPISKFQYISRL